MCGIVSTFYPDNVQPPSAEDLKNRLEASLEIIKYRGPDSRGTYISPDARVGLGHVRLAIIDLATGQQPLSDEEDLVHCVVAGEIYDHDRIRAELQSQGYPFKSKSDSELVVQLYKRDGFNCLFNLRGEFTFVLYDVKRRLQFVARDRFGIKPLYYTVSNGCVMFGNEMKTFAPLGWKPEWDLDSIVQNAAAGSFRRLRSVGSIRTEAYWDYTFPAPAAPPPGSLDTMISTVRERLVEAVSLRMRADVPWAVYLSGGIDSSAIAGIATHLLREKNPDAKLTTFTLAYTEDPTTDETPQAARTAAHIGADMITVPATEAALVGMFEESIWHSELPGSTFHGAGKLLLSKAVRDGGYKVALSGEGSDESFGGYPWFPLDYLREADPAAASLGLPLPSEAERRALAAGYSAATRMPDLPANAQARGKADGPRALLNTSAHLFLAPVSAPLGPPAFSAATLAQFGQPNPVRCVEQAIPTRVRQNSVEGKWHSLHVSLYVGSKTMMTNVILNINGDLNDMANSIESRPAFLDHHFVEYINSLPPSLKIRPIKGTGPGGWSLAEKWILREAVKPFVTDEMYLRKKAPFNPPPAPRREGSTGLLPLQAHLKARVTQEKVERIGFVSWPFVEAQLGAYLEQPMYPAMGMIDPRARVLMTVLSYIVLQERFEISQNSADPRDRRSRASGASRRSGFCANAKPSSRSSRRCICARKCPSTRLLLLGAKATGLLPLQAHLKARITQEKVERIGFVNWPFVQAQLAAYTYLEQPMYMYPAMGMIDPRARVLMTVLSYIVLQEWFEVPSYRG
ncbi:asparagine synthase-domain-containing protein [Mycena galopus ATCC 62051]|nr:asparagine synthase-domain-containing protein [Mycena galopus ATCC 62051]